MLVLAFSWFVPSSEPFCGFLQVGRKTVFLMAHREKRQMTGGMPCLNLGRNGLAAFPNFEHLEAKGLERVADLRRNLGK